MRKQIMVNGQPVDRYNSLEPSYCYAEETIKTGYGRLRLVHFRDHVARLFRIVAGPLNYELPISTQTFEGEYVDWDAVSGALHMACSISDLHADTTFVDESESWGWCGDAFDADEAHSEVASKFMTGLITFNFLCSAFESIVALSSKYPGEKTALYNKAERVLLGAGTKPEAMPFFKETLFSTWSHCEQSGDFAKELKRCKRQFKSTLPVLSSKIVCQLRNKFAHGKFIVPSAGDWGALSSYDANHDPMICRFYSAGRLILLLIQAIAIELIGVKKIFVPHRSSIDWSDDCEKYDLRDHLMHLHVITNKEPESQMHLPFSIFPK